jgi:hypothetical protein
VVVAEHAAAGQGVLVQVAGLGVAAHVPQSPGKVGAGCPGVLVIIAELLPPVPAQAGRKVMAGAGIGAGQQVPSRVAGHPAQVAAAGGGQVGGQQVRAGQKPARSANKRTGRRPLSNPPLHPRGTEAPPSADPCGDA